MAKLYNPSSQAEIKEFEPGTGKKYNLPCEKVTEIPDDIKDIFLKQFEFLIDVEKMSKEEAAEINKAMKLKEKKLLKCSHKDCSFVIDSKRALVIHELQHKKDEKEAKELKNFNNKKVEDMQTGELI